MSLSWLCLGGDDHATLAHFLLVKSFAGHCEVGDQSILASEDGHHFPHQNGESLLLSTGEGVWQIEAPRCRAGQTSETLPLQGGTERPEKCLETGKQQNPLWGKTVLSNARWLERAGYQDPLRRYSVAPPGIHSTQPCLFVMAFGLDQGWGVSCVSGGILWHDPWTRMVNLSILAK